MYSNLVAEMKANGVSKSDLQKLLQVHYNSVLNKLAHRTCFTIDEAVKIQKEFFPGCELAELFKAD